MILFYCVMGGAKVFGQNVRWFSDHLWESAEFVKHCVRISSLCSLRICVQNLSRTFRVEIVLKFLKDTKMAFGQLSNPKMQSKIDAKDYSACCKVLNKDLLIKLCSNKMLSLRLLRIVRVLLTDSIIFSELIDFLHVRTCSIISVKLAGGSQL